MFGYTTFALLFWPVAVAVWRAGGMLDEPQRSNLRPPTPMRLTAAQSVAIIGSLVAALTTTRAALKEARDKLAPTEAELAAQEAEDATVDAAVLEAKAALDAFAAEDNPPTDPIDPPPVDPAPTDPAPNPGPDSEL